MIIVYDLTVVLVQSPVTELDTYKSERAHNSKDKSSHCDTLSTDLKYELLRHFSAEHIAPLLFILGIIQSLHQTVELQCVLNYTCLLYTSDAADE